MTAPRARPAIANGDPAELLPVAAEALEAALEAIPSPAFVLDDGGRIIRSNAAGESMLRADGDATLDRIRREGRAMPFGVPGARAHVLAVVPAPAGDLRPRVAVAARRWKLTRREVDVLALVCEGRTNVAIARALRISEKTVEVRVTGLLRKSGSSSRAKLVSSVWAAVP